MKKRMIFICLTILCVIVVFVNMKPTHPNKEVTAPETQEKEDEIYQASFLAVGDNIIHSTIYRYNQQSDGSYDFKDVYQYTKELTESADFSYINMETICAGVEYELSNYPQFNGPVEVIDAVADAGFDWLSASSNHSYDRREKGILAQLKYTRSHHPELIMTGLHDSYEDSQQCQVVDVKGIKVGLLSYTYGLNGFTLPEGKEYLVDLIDKDKMKADMERIKEVSDIQMVSMHWGIEYQFEPTETQKELAQYLSDLGADVIIGTHPHVIQPVEYLTGKDGNQTLVMYSLGNFLSAQDENRCMLGGMMTWNIEFNKTQNVITIKDVKFLPTVTQIEGRYQVHRTYALKDWNDELGQKHTLSTRYGQTVTRQYFIDLVHDVIGDEIEIVE